MDYSMDLKLKLNWSKRELDYRGQEWFISLKWSVQQSAVVYLSLSIYKCQLIMNKLTN